MKLDFILSIKVTFNKFNNHFKLQSFVNLNFRMLSHFHAINNLSNEFIKCFILS